MKKIEIGDSIIAQSFIVFLVFLSANHSSKYKLVQKQREFRFVIHTSYNIEIIQKTNKSYFAAAVVVFIYITSLRALFHITSNP